MKYNLTERLCEMVSNVNGCVDAFESNEITLDPFT
jgi:hypothetical protein